MHMLNLMYPICSLGLLCHCFRAFILLNPEIKNEGTYMRYLHKDIDATACDVSGVKTRFRFRQNVLALSAPFYTLLVVLVGVVLENGVKDREYFITLILRKNGNPTRYGKGVDRHRSSCFSWFWYG